MPAGIQIWNADGTLQFDTTNRLFRVLTTADIGGADSGSATVSNVQGTLAVVAVPSGAGTVPPTVTVSGNRVNWNYGGQASRQATHLVFMEY